MVEKKSEAAAQREKKKKKRKKAQRESLKLLASGCPERQDVPGVRIPGVSCLASGRSCQDVLLWDKARSRLIGATISARPFRCDHFDANISVRPFRRHLFRCRTFSAQITSVPIWCSLTVDLFRVRVSKKHRILAPKRSTPK